MGIAEMILTSPAFEDVPGNINYREPRYCRKCGNVIEDEELERNEYAEYCHRCRMEKEEWS